MKSEVKGTATSKRLENTGLEQYSLGVWLWTLFLKPASLCTKILVTLRIPADEIAWRHCIIRARRREGEWHVLTEKQVSKSEVHHALRSFLSRTKIKIFTIWSSNTFPPRKFPFLLAMMLIYWKITCHDVCKNTDRIINYVESESCAC
jgi:hypothetical protein